MNGGALLLLANDAGTGIRPAPIPHAPIAPPFDPNDSGGAVHTTLPPEQVIPPHFTDPTFLRADFNGVTLGGNWVNVPGGVRITSGRWDGLFVPFISGANTTPPTMLMTPQVIRYPADVQHAVLTEHAERGYDDFIIDCAGWGGPSFSPAEMLAWCQTLKAWGFRVVFWRGDPDWVNPIDPMLDTLMQNAAIDFYIHGEEVDRKTIMETYEAGLDVLNAAFDGIIPIGVHFTCDGDRKMAYPIGFPRDTFLLDWSKYDGRVHLMLQNDSTAPAGLQGASTYYGRLRVMGQGDGARGPGAPNSRVIAFETMATAQLYGSCSENYGNLRDWELLCGTRTDPRIPPVSGFGNGCRYPNGDPI